MTLIIRAKCQDRIVIGSDSAATFAAGSTSTIKQPSSKIDIIDDKILCACSGHVGLAQLIVERVM